MRTNSNERLVATKVLVKFEDGPVFFRIPFGATLADVSEKFGKIGRWHKGRALSIDVRFGTAFDRPRLSAQVLASSLISQLAAAGSGSYGSDTAPGIDAH